MKKPMIGAIREPGRVSQKGAPQMAQPPMQAQPAIRAMPQPPMNPMQRAMLVAALQRKK